MDKFNIVSISNFDLDTYNEHIVAKDVPIYYAKVIVEDLNKNCSGQDCADYFVIKPTDYVPHVFEP
ncbi:orf22 [Lactobacillus phage LP65]|uniref:Orf22 n=1 Tax=Lactobacillus phage LP65 TaxID=2892344 RepID=Q5ULU2_9CAUD|nr:hypothetical protein LP65_gp022 [Lactobacillus phage LP65]AAV35842.1 orf22 [Lactobacillus phage LP65]